MKQDDLISRSALLAEYDRAHGGEVDGDRKLIEDAPAVDIGSMWADLTYEDPVDGEAYLVIASGQPRENIFLQCAYDLGTYYESDGWVLGMYPEWENPTIHAWMPLPEWENPEVIVEACDECRITYSHERGESE